MVALQISYLKQSNKKKRPGQTPKSANQRRKQCIAEILYKYALANLSGIIRVVPKWWRRAISPPTHVNYATYGFPFFNILTSYPINN